MEQKSIALIVVALVVGVAAGAGIGMVAFGDDNNDDEKYYFYIDYGTAADADTQNKWVEVSSDSPLNALKAAMKKVDPNCGISDSGWISTINGVGGEALHTWGSWFWEKTVFDTQYMSAASPYWISNPGFGQTIGNVFYIGYTAYNGTTYVYDLDPNADATAEWASTGPFASA